MRNNKEFARTVTRTMNRNIATIEVADMVAREFADRRFIYAGSRLSDESVLKQARKELDSETVRVLQVKYTETESVRYGMTEEDFMKYGHIINDDDKTAGRYVTRTINFNTAHIEVADMVERAFIVKDYEYTGPVLKDDVLMKVAMKQLDSDLIRVLSIKGQDTIPVRYGMTESDFMRFGYVMAETTESLDYGDDQ